MGRRREEWEERGGGFGGKFARSKVYLKSESNTFLT